MRVVPLIEAPAARPVLVRWYVAEWPSWYGPGGRGDARADLAAASHCRDSLPLALVALDATDALLDLGARGPVFVGLEDLHWSDDLTLQILEALAVRLGDRPLLAIGTYRSDELFPRVPMREWRARLLARRLAEEVRVTRLDEAGTAAMTSAILGSDLPAARDLVATVLERSDGIPLHIEEILALPRGGDLLDFVGSAFAAPGRGSWTVVDLSAGRYAVVCFVPIGATTPEELRSGQADATTPLHHTQGMFAEVQVP